MKETNEGHLLSEITQSILFVLFMSLWIADSFIFNFSTFWADYISLNIRLIILCITLFFSGCLIKSGHVTVDNKKKPEGLITSGAFHYVRHPLYLGNTLLYLGLAISTLSISSLFLAMVIFIFYDFITVSEENLLVKRFNGAYLIYKRRTGKWLPVFGKN